MRTVRFRATMLVALLVAAVAVPAAHGAGGPRDAVNLDWQRRGGSTGRITGSLGFPSEVVPPLIIYAIRVDAGSAQFASVRSAFNQLDYEIDGLTPGVYVVLAYLESMPTFSGGYTTAVPCGLTVACTDHTLIPVTVRAGETISGVDIRDWYAPPGAFPPRPDE